MRLSSCLFRFKTSRLCSPSAYSFRRLFPLSAHALLSKQVPRCRRVAQRRDRRNARRKIRSDAAGRAADARSDEAQRPGRCDLRSRTVRNPSVTVCPGRRVHAALRAHGARLQEAAVKSSSARPELRRRQPRADYRIICFRSMAASPPSSASSTSSSISTAIRPKIAASWRRTASRRSLCPTCRCCALPVWTISCCPIPR